MPVFLNSLIIVTPPSSTPALGRASLHVLPSVCTPKRAFLGLHCHRSFQELPFLGTDTCFTELGVKNKTCHEDSEINKFLPNNKFHR